jgi:hypothetical protein
MYSCTVCGDPAEAAMTAVCNWCDARYHLNQRSDVEARDCGQVWIDEQFLALQFACNRCLQSPGSPAGTPLAHSRPSQRARKYKRRM